MAWNSAENLGVEIFQIYSCDVILENDVVKGLTGEMGISKDGEKKASYQPHGIKS